LLLKGFKPAKVDIVWLFLYCIPYKVLELVGKDSKLFGRQLPVPGCTLGYMRVCRNSEVITLTTLLAYRSAIQPTPQCRLSYVCKPWSCL